jgi:hypothetical protein
VAKAVTAAQAKLPQRPEHAAHVQQSVQKPRVVAQARPVSGLPPQPTATHVKSSVAAVQMRPAAPPAAAPHVRRSLAAAQRPAPPGQVQRKISPVVQRTTIALSYEGETDESRTAILNDATAFHNAHGTGRLIDQDGTVVAGMADPQDTRIDIFAHGNQAEVGDHTPQAMAAFLLHHPQRPQRLENVVIHACESASLHPDTGEIYSHRLYRELVVEHAHYVEVTGHAGRTFTDQTGQSRVLIDENQELAYRQALAQALAGQGNRTTVENQFLRPAGERRRTFGFDPWEPDGNMYGATRQETIDNLNWIRTETESPDPIPAAGLPYHTPL